MFARIKALRNEAHDIKAQAGDHITAEQIDLIEAKLNEADALEAQAKRLEAATARMGQKTSVQAGPVRIESGKDSIERDPKAGFSTSQEMFKAIVKNRGEAGNDHRLRMLAAVGSDEMNGTQGAYGGFAIPEVFITEQLKVDAPMDPTTPYCRTLPMDAPVVKLSARVDKNHSSSVTGGTQVYRRGEMGALTTSRQNLEQIVLSANSLDGLTYATNELIQDSPSTVAALLASFPEAFADKEFQEKLNGTGVGQFLGIMKSPALITVLKESAQTADTINVANLGKMMARVHGLDKAIWLLNHDALPQILALGTSGYAANIWQPSAAEGMPATLYGRPVFFTEYCSALGDLGDIVLCNWSEYLVGNYQGVTNASSIHVRFENSEEGFKFTKRNDARPWWTSVLTPKNGSTKSPFVTLEAR
jgi:HK97 family phage major capsid protein